MTGLDEILRQVNATTEPLTTYSIADITGLHPSIIERTIRELNIPAAGFVRWYSRNQAAAVLRHIVAEQLDPLPETQHHAKTTRHQSPIHPRKPAAPIANEQAAGGSLRIAHPSVGSRDQGAREQRHVAGGGDPSTNEPGTNAPRAVPGGVQPPAAAELIDTGHLSTEQE